MKNLIKNKSFLFGFALGIFLIILANIYFAFAIYAKIDFGILNYGHSFDGYLAIGFPFPVFERWANSTIDFYWISVLANIFIAIIFSVLMGWLFKFVLLKKHNSQNTFYNKAFKLGFWINVLIFLILNYFSYLTAYSDYHKVSNIQFSIQGYVCGFPFRIYEYIIANPSRVGFVFEGIVINTFITVVCGFIMGSIFRFDWSKFTKDKLK